MAYFAAALDPGENNASLNELLTGIIERSTPMDENAQQANHTIGRINGAQQRPDVGASRCRTPPQSSRSVSPFSTLSTRLTRARSRAGSQYEQAVSRDITSLPYINLNSNTTNPALSLRSPGLHAAPDRDTSLVHEVRPASQTESIASSIAVPYVRQPETATMSRLPLSSAPTPTTSRSQSRHMSYRSSPPTLAETPSPGLSKTRSARSVEIAFSGFAPHPGVRPLATINSEGVFEEATGPTDDDHQYPESLALFLIVIGICLSVLIISLDRSIITTAIARITSEFHSYDDIGWYGSAYLLTASAFQPLFGRIYMSFNIKSSFLSALAIFELGSLICGVAPSSNVLIIGRAIQGLGSAGVLTGSFVVGTHSVRLRARPVLFALVGMLYGVGALAGPLLGGTFTELVSWRWCFYVNLPIGGVTFICIILFFRPQTHAIQDGKHSFLRRIFALDWIGNFILLGACAMLFLALQSSEERYSWSSARCIGLICGFGVTALIFIAWLFYRGPNALIPMHIVKQRTVAASCGAAFFIYGALLLHAYYLPIWFQAIKDTTAIQSGVDMIPYMVTNAFFGLCAGVFVSSNGLFAPPAILGCAIGTIGAGILATLHPNTSTAAWAGFEVLVSAGLGMAIQQGFSAVQTALPPHEVPIGTAAVVACQSAGGAIFVSVGNTLLQNHLLNANNDSAIPGVNVRSIIELGATKFRDVVPMADLPKLIELYNASLQAAFIAAVPLCGCAFLCSLCMEWRSVKRAPSEEQQKLVNEDQNPSMAEKPIREDVESNIGGAADFPGIGDRDRPYPSSPFKLHLASVKKRLSSNT